MLGAGEKIVARRKKLGWTQTKLATLAGISQSFLWRLESGKTTGSWETYAKIASALGLKTQALYPEGSNVDDAEIGGRRIPMLTYQELGKWDGSFPYVEDQSMREHILTDLEHSSSLFALTICDDSMEPEFRAGDRIVIDPEQVPSPGDYVVAKDQNGNATFKQYKEVGLNDHKIQVFELQPLNGVYPRWRSDVQTITIIGVMIEHRRYRRK